MIKKDVQNWKKKNYVVEKYNNNHSCIECNKKNTRRKLMEKIYNDFSDMYAYREKEDMALLDEMIKNDIKEEENWEVRDILARIMDIEDYDAKRFIYNNGKLRTEKEVNDYNERIRRKEEIEAYKRRLAEGKAYGQSAEYESMSKATILPWIPSIIYFLVMLFNFESDPVTSVDMFMFSPLVLIFSVILSNKLNKEIVKTGDEHNVPKDNPIYKKASFNYKSGSIALTGAVIGAAHSVRNAAKDTVDPSKWGNSI